MDGWLTVPEVAKGTSLSQEQVRRLIRDKEIKAVKLASWFIHPIELERFVLSRMNVRDEVPQGIVG